MKQKKMIFLIGSFLTSLMVVFLISRQVNISNDPPALPKIDLVLVAPETLPEGAIMTVSKMSWKEWKTDTINADYLTQKDHAGLTSVDGGVVRSPIFKGEPVRASKIIKTQGKSAIAAVIREGMRAVTIPYSKLANAPSLIAPGDIVDVIIPKRSQGNTDVYFGQTIMTNVRILAVNKELQKIGETDDKSTLSAQTITLEVTAPQAEDLAGAIRDGQVVISMQSIFAKTSPLAQGKKGKEGEKSEISSPPPIKVITIMRGVEKKDVTFNNTGK